MALQDILHAITHEADERIKAAQSEHKQKMKASREAHELALLDIQQRINEQKKRKMTQLKERAVGHAHMMLSHSLLQKKQELLKETYDETVEALCAMPAAKQEAFLKQCLEAIDVKGTIHPAKPHAALLKKLAGSDFKVGEPIEAKGGFRFVGDKQERDYTFEFLVLEVLRHATEVDAAHTLFSDK
jgi:vacuolar-type H+-ATPase subunit E/Vma4